MVFASILAAHALFCAQTDRIEIPVLHQRASKVLAKMQGTKPDDVKWQADDERGVIVAQGSKEDLNPLPGYVNLFDVVQRPVSIDMVVTSPIDKISYKVSTTIPNYESWTSADSGTGLAITIMPRLNDDNSITLFATVLDEKQHSPVKTVVRIKSKETAEFVLLKSGAIEVTTQDPRSEKAAPSNPKATRIRVTATAP